MYSHINCPDCDSTDVTLDRVEYHPDFVTGVGTAVLTFHCRRWDQFSVLTKFRGKSRVRINDGDPWNALVGESE